VFWLPVRRQVRAPTLRAAAAAAAAAVASLGSFVGSLLFIQVLAAST
jgi:hypothetical protein